MLASLPLGHVAARVSTLVVSLAMVWSLGFAGVAVASPARMAADAVAALARGDARAPAACRSSLRRGVAVVACDRRRRDLPVLRARGRREYRLPCARTGPGAWGFAVLGSDVVDLDLRTFTVTARPDAGAD